MDQGEVLHSSAVRALCTGLLSQLEVGVAGMGVIIGTHHMCVCMCV